MKLRALITGMTLVTAGTVIGVSGQHFASADVSSGDRPVLVPIEPCRLVDTRPGDATVGPRASRLGAAETYTVDAQQTDVPCVGNIPTDARSLALNVTSIGATEQTFLTIWAGGTRPKASSLNPAPGEPPTPNAVTVELSADQDFKVYNDVGTVNIIVDVTGYYANHDHDDRYHTRAQAQAEFLTASQADGMFALDTDLDLKADVAAVTPLLPTAFGNINAFFPDNLTRTTGVASIVENAAQGRYEFTLVVGAYSIDDTTVLTLNGDYGNCPQGTSIRESSVNGKLLVYVLLANGAFATNCSFDFVTFSD